MNHASDLPEIPFDAPAISFADVPTREKVLIVGAGPAGLAAAASLKAARVPFDLVDSASDVGGIWNTERADSPVWPSLEMVSSTQFTQFEDLLQPVSFPAYLNPAQMAKYLRAYAARYDLTDQFIPRTTVRYARPFEEGVWQVETSDGAVSVYRGLIAAHGISSRPHLPEWAGSVPAGIRTLHSSQWEGAAGLEGKRVLVVGSGQSAADIAVDAARRALEVRWSVRTGHWIVPRTVAGTPGDVAAAREPAVLGSLNERIAEQVITRAVGTPEALGLPRPAKPLLEDRVIVSDELSPRIRDGRIAPVGAVSEVREDGSVSFARGADYLPDVIVFATGYEGGADYLPGDILPRTASGAPDLFLGTFPRTRDDLVLLGQARVNGGVLPLLTQQADLAAYFFQAQLSGSPKADVFRRVRDGADESVDRTPDPGLRERVSALLPAAGALRGRRAHPSAVGASFPGAHAPGAVSAAPTGRGARAALPLGEGEDQATLVPFVDRDQLVERLQRVRSIFE
ncbi:NAD(P)-binding domain-containing protein [Brachybacterium sp. JHP9]|uniref:NAD(P)-binding domain-containing protein n=1 Tax=Brachybacterium equifaecis TaxID=2910770 RepID=A0ABT0QXJ6_9MICO|nr:NAD(P)-binding domain-containing protein [Brachybacterium equifaecis]MCL6422369.1 NAD(P)-binding domain-containing protein [Brachybacterium equifaecis]